MSFDFLSQDIRIFCGMQHQKGLTKTRGKRRPGFGNAKLRPGNLGRVPAQVVIHPLRLGQFGDRGQNAIRITGQEDNCFRVSPFGDRFDDFLDMVNGIGNARVFRFFLGGKIDLAVVSYIHILQQGVAPDSTINIRFSLQSDIDAFCVTTTFEIKDPFIVPAMLVIADQQPLGIR